MYTEMHRPGDAAAADTAAKPVLGDIIEHVYEDDTHNNNNNSNDGAATTATTIGNSTSAQGSAAADAAATLAEPHVVHVTERLAARLRPIQAVVGQAFPPVRPHTSYRVPPPSTTSISNAQTAGRPHAAMQRTERTLSAGDATRATAAMSAAVPSQHRHHQQQYTDAAAMRDSHTPPAAAALATSSSSRRVQGGMQYSAHVQPDMPSLEESADRATTLRFSRPSFAAALPTSHTTTTTATRTTITTTKSDDVVQPFAVHNASGSNNSSTTATTCEMPELLGRLPVGGISMRATATATSGSAAGDASAAAAESVAVPHQWSPADFVHMYRGYYAVPMTEGGEEDVLAAAQQKTEKGEEMYGYGLPHALQDWSHNNNNNTTTTTSECTTTTSAHDASSVPTGEAYLRLLRCGLCSTVPRHQIIAMHALLLHLRYEGAVLRARCLQGGGAGGGDRHEGVDWLQGLLTRMTQATQVLPCKLAARCLLALLSPTTNNNNKKSSTSMSAAAAAAANAMQPSEVLVHALREVAFPLTDATTAHKARRGEHSEEEQGEDDEGDETRAGPQLPRTMDEVERLLGSGDEADIALAAEALGLTEKLLLAMPLLLHTMSPPQQQQQHEEEVDNDEMRAENAGRHTATAASTTSVTQGDDGHNNSNKRASGTSKRPAHSYNTSSSSSNRRAHAAETLFLRLLRCGGVGLSEQTSCMRVARDVPFVLWAEQQLSDVVLGERGLASVLPLLGVLHDLAHCPAALTVLLTTMSSSSSISSSSAYTSKLLTNNNSNNTRVAVAGRGSSSNNNNDASARPHAAAHETWLLFALYVCSMDVTRKAHTRRTHTGHGGDAVHTCNTNKNNTDKEDEEEDEEEEEMAAAVTMSLLLLRELIRHGVGLTLFLRDACGTILETGMTMGAAMLLEMWLVLLDQQEEEEQQEHKKDEEGNDPHNKDSSTCAAHVHERPEQAIFDEAARIAWHLYHHSLTSHTEGITAAATVTLAATATDRNNDTREEEEEVRAQAQAAHEADTTITTTHAEDSTGTHHTLPAHTLHEEDKTRAQRPARRLSSLQEEVAAVSNAHFLATYLTSRAVAVGSTHGKAHHMNKTKEGDEEEEGGREVKEEAGSEDATAAAAASSSSASLLSFFGSAAETRRQVLALLTDLVACEDTAVVLCESLQPGAAGRTPALSAATPTPTTTAASSCDTHTQTSPSSSLAQRQQQQQQADMPCSEVTGHTQAIEQQPQQCDGVRAACTTARRYANARLACAIHTAWASSSSSSSSRVLLPEASPLLHRYGTRVLAAFVHRCLYTHTAPSSSSSSSLAVMKTLRRLQPEELSTVLELMDLVQRTAQHPSSSPSLSQRGTTATETSREATGHNEEEEEGEAYDGQRLVCMAALLVLQGMCVTGHCLDGAPRALRCLLQCDTKVDAKAKKAATAVAAAADKSSSIITPTGTVSTAGTPLTASSSHHPPPPPLSLSSPPVVHAAWSARQAALAACLCAGLERAAGLRVAFADPTADCTSSNNTEGRGTGGGDEDDEARTTLIGGGAEGRPWLLYPLYYNNNNRNKSSSSSSSVDEADTQDKKNNNKEDEGEVKEEHNGNNCITSGSNDVVAEMRVDKAVWAHWVMGLTRLQPRLTREVLQCDVVLSHALLWTLAHRARLFAAEATPKTPPPTPTATTATTATTAACTTTSTSDDDDDEACDMTAAEVHALCELLAELALLLVPAEVGSSSSTHWDSTKKKENRDDAGGEKTGTTTTSASTTVRSAVSVPPAAAAQPPRACAIRQEDEHEHEHEHDEQTTKESEVHAPLTSSSRDAAHARLSAPPCRFSHAASATLGIPLQAYANPQSEAAMPAIVHCVLGLVAAHAQPATSLAALQLLLSTPVCPTTNTRATAAGTMCGNDGGCSDDATVKSAHSHAGRRYIQRGQKDDDEHNDEAGVGECVAPPQQEGDDATVADDRMSRLRAALTWWSAAVQPGSHASHSVRNDDGNDATDVGVMHDAACTAAASAKGGGGLVQAAASSHHDTTTIAAACTSCEVVRWSLTQLVALLQLVGPHLSSRTHKYSPTPRMAHTHHHHPHDDDDAEGDDDDEVMSDAAEDAEDEEMRAAHDMHTTTNSNDEEEEDVRRWCVETVTDGLLRRYLYSHTKASTAAATAADTRTSQPATAASISAADAEAVQLSAMEQTVLRETLRQLHWRPAVLWPYVA